MISYNNGGIIPLDELDKILEKYGILQKIPINHKIYNRMRGIANYKREGEDKGVKEFIRSSNNYFSHIFQFDRFNFKTFF